MRKNFRHPDPKLESENAKRKRLLAIVMLDRGELQDSLANEFYCRVIDTDRKSVRYRSTRHDDYGLREKLRTLANQRRRFGCGRLHILLCREGIMFNRKKTQRLYRKEGLAV